MIDDRRALIPKHKSDIDTAQAAVDAGYPAVEPILPDLVEWLQDLNWPVAKLLAPFLASLGHPMLPQIRRVMATDDHMWKYWVMDVLISQLDPSLAQEFRPQVERMANYAGSDEEDKALAEHARWLKEQLGWQ